MLQGSGARAQCVYVCLRTSFFANRSVFAGWEGRRDDTCLRVDSGAVLLKSQPSVHFCNRGWGESMDV